MHAIAAKYHKPLSAICIIKIELWEGIKIVRITELYYILNSQEERGREKREGVYM